MSNGIVLPRHRKLLDAQGYKAPPKTEATATCDRCQGNGEIVTDWERYLHGPLDENGDDAVVECPDCDGGQS